MSSLHNYQILIGNWEIWKLGNLFKEEDKIIVVALVTWIRKGHTPSINIGTYNFFKEALSDDIIRELVTKQVIVPTLML